MKKYSCFIWSALGITGASLLIANPTTAQIVPDATLPDNSIVTPQGNVNLIEGGTTTGSNLFHSFREFSIPTGGTVFFNNAINIQNIFSRVTGNAISNIDGLIRANGSANLFLLNPNGIIFGGNARLNIGGSFLASTANSINFTDGTQFSATATQTAPLLTVSIPTGLQYGANSGNIIVQGEGLLLPESTLEETNEQGIARELAFLNSPIGLQVQPKRTIALVGGDVTLQGGIIKAPSGRIELGSVTGSGLVTLNPTNSGWSLGYERVQNFGNIQLEKQSWAFASGEGAGDIQVRGRRLTLTDASQIVTNTLGSETAGNLVVTTSETVELLGKAPDNQSVSRLVATTYGTGSASNVTINTRRLVLQNGGVGTVSTGDGRVGDLTINASESVELKGISSNEQSASGLITVTGGKGDAGNVTINTGSLTIANGLIITLNIGEGKAGDITVNASESVELASSNVKIASAMLAGTGNQGDAGNVTINTGRFAIENGAIITGTTGEGKAGNITVNANESVELKSTLPDAIIPSGLAAGTASKGDAGNVTINTGRFAIDNAGILTITSGEGKAGNISVNASDSVELGGILGAGNAGNITIITGKSIAEDFVKGDGNAANIINKAINLVNLNDGASRVQNGSGLLAQAQSKGDAGNVTITTRELLVRDGAGVNVRSEKEGNPGSLFVNSRNLILNNQGSLNASSSTGQGGNIQLQGRSIQLRHQSEISAASAPGTAEGNIGINVESLVLLEGSQIRTDAIDPNGGSNIRITSDNSAGLVIFQSLDSAISASGDVTVEANIQPQTSNIPQVEVVDATALIASTCRRDSSQQSQFTVTGRGGLPYNPNEILNDDAIWIDLRQTIDEKPPLQEENIRSFLPSNRKSASEIVEAQGWLIGSDGKVILTANPLTVTAYSPGIVSPSCHH
ncbi:MAG TPA: filamentous hemagglutinin N-terminal domain-containing protein [Leptolyngbyaceae cyanobacterium]